MSTSDDCSSWMDVRLVLGEASRVRKRSQDSRRAVEAGCTESGQMLGEVAGASVGETWVLGDLGL